MSDMQDENKKVGQPVPPVDEGPDVGFPEEEVKPEEVDEPAEAVPSPEDEPKPELEPEV